MKINKVLTTVLLIAVLSVICVNFAYATSTTSETYTVDPSTITGTSTDGASKITALGGKIVGIVQTVGSVVSVVILVVLGIRYMIGSTEEKAEYKKTLLPYVIGAVLIFAASNLASVVYNMARGI